MPELLTCPRCGEPAVVGGESATASWAAGELHGRKVERAQTVAWLRRQAADLPASSEILEWAADEIEGVAP